jgi:hypothetical protein
MGLNWWQETTIEHDVSIDVLNAQMLTANETIAALQPLISANTTAISSLQESVSANITAISTLNTDLAEIAKQANILKDKQLLRPYLLEGFQVVSDFTPNGHCTLEADTVNYKVGTQGLKMLSSDTAATGSATSAKTLIIADIEYFEIEFYIYTYTSFTDIWLYLLNGGNGYYGSYNSTYFKQGWNTARFKKSTMSVMGTAPATTTSIQITISCYKGGVSGNVTLARFEANSHETANIIFTADESYASLYTVAFPYMQSKSLKGCGCLSKVWVDTASHITTAQAQEMYAAGWDMLNHGAAHLSYNTSTYNASVNDIEVNKLWLEDCGFTRGSDIIAYPLAYYDKGKIAANDCGYICGRDSQGAFQSGDLFDLMNMQAYPMNYLDTLTTFRLRFDKLLDVGGVMVIYFHDIMDTPTSGHLATSVFHEMIDYVAIQVAAGLCNCVTYSEWLASRYGV